MVLVVVVERVRTARPLSCVCACVQVVLSSRLHAAALAVHVALLDAGFVCTGSNTQDQALAGFAPAAKGEGQPMYIPAS